MKGGHDVLRRQNRFLLALLVALKAPSWKLHYVKLYNVIQSKYVLYIKHIREKKFFLNFYGNVNLIIKN